MSLPEWLVLAILSEQPMHGFALARLTAPGGELGRIWQIPKAVIYRAIGRLLDSGLVTPEGTQPGLGPLRTVYTATPAGREAVRCWLHTPVQHVRDIRSHLLLKLALLDRAGDDPADLLRGQRAVLEPIAQAIEARITEAGHAQFGHGAAGLGAAGQGAAAPGIAERGGFDAILLAWRRATVAAALDFIDTITAPAPRHP
jgi:DNA-binding PadR family transcriptional regulator